MSLLGPNMQKLLDKFGVHYCKNPGHVVISLSIEGRIAVDRETERLSRTGIHSQRHEARKYMRRP
jgi:hypothetical protein